MTRRILDPMKKDKSISASEDDGDRAEPVSSGGRYTRVAIMLHWTTVAFVLSTIPLGLYGASSEGVAAQTATNIHKSIGICILILTVARIVWRRTHRPPALPQDYTPALARIAKVTHILFYVLLIILPLSGWWMSSAVPDRHAFGIGAIQIPFLPVPRGWASAGPAHAIHTNLAWLMIGLILLHVAAVLKHQFFDKDDILARMLPRRV